MSTTDKILYFIFTVLGFAIGLTIAKIYQNFSFFEFDNKVDLVGVISLFITAGIAIGIPLFLKKLIDDNRSVKGLLADEIKDLIAILCEIKQILTSCYEVGEITPKDKDKINYIFHTAELQIFSIQQQLDISFNIKSKPLIKEMKDKYFEYNNDLTGGVLMTSKFSVIDDIFRREHDTSLSNYITHIKGLVHQIHKF